MLKQQILELRSQNKTYQEISQILHCSKSTVCYYCGDNQKEKNNNRLKKIRQKRHPYAKKIEFFCQSYNKPINKTQISTFRKRIECKIRSFHRIQHSKLGIKAMYQSPSFTVDDVINKFGENPKCYLTGDTINIYDTKSYNFDHIIPRSRGGLNDIDNLGICTKLANQMKHNMTVAELLIMCQKVIKHHQSSE